MSANVGLENLLERTPFDRERVLVSAQLQNGVRGGVLQAILAYIKTKPTANDTFILTDGTTTETYTYKSSRAAAFQVAIGADAAASQTNLIAAIVADSAPWTASAQTAFDDYFTGTVGSQFIVYRRMPPPDSAGNDRIYGVQTATDGIQVCSFSEVDYTTTNATQANIPATDPGAKRFGFGRRLEELQVGERHMSYASVNYAWRHHRKVWEVTTEVDTSALALETGGHLEETADHCHAIDASVRAPILGTSVYTAITATTTAMAADLAIGEYLFKVLTGERVTFRINGAGVTTAAVWATSPGIILEDVYLPVKLSAISRIVAICATGETATLMTLPVT